MASYVLINYDWTSFDKEITLKRTPSRFFRFLGSKTSIHKFIGNGTVWHEEIDELLYRCSSNTESMLSDFFMGIRRHERLKNN